MDFFGEPMLSVKPRYDGRGDAWSSAHREALGKTFNMMDMDALMGFHVFAQNSGEKLFVEYVPDDYKFRNNAIRRFGFVALFDRKCTIERAFSEDNRVSFAVYLHLCRCLRSTQNGYATRFFFVIGGQKPPWSMQEIDIDSALPIGESIYISNAENGSWRSIWEACGLAEDREIIRKWVQRG